MSTADEAFIGQLREFVDGDVKVDDEQLIFTTNDADRIIQMFRQHGMRFAVRSTHSRRLKSRTMWSSRDVDYFGSPFFIKKSVALDCVRGKNYKGSGSQFQANDGQPTPPERQRNRTTSKIGCPARMKMTEIIAFPEYELTETDQMCLRHLKEKKLKELNSVLKGGLGAKGVSKFFFWVSKPSKHTHYDPATGSLPYITRDVDFLQYQQSYNKAKSQNWASRMSNPGGSLKDWVEDMNARGTLVRYFKEKGDAPYCEDLRIDDFVLIVFNEVQLEVFQKFSKSCVCVDQVLNQKDDYLLTSLIVVDDLKQGLPTAFMLSNRVDCAIMKIFFQSIKTALGRAVETELFVSEVGDFYSESWSAVMLPLKTVLYSPWGVRTEWENNLELIGDQESKELIHKNLLTMLEESDEDNFNVVFEDICRWMVENDSTQEFGVDFIRHFGGTADLWAACGRKDVGVNFKLTLERAHDTLQNICLQGRNVKTLPEAVQDVMYFPKDRFLQRLHPRAKMERLRDGHRKANKLQDCEFLKEGETWILKAADASILVAIVEFNLACGCYYKCPKCHGCSHMFVCSCTTSSLNWNMCKHIHLLCMLSGLPDIPRESPEGERGISHHEGETNEVDEFAEERNRITGLLAAIEKRMQSANTKEEFKLVQEILQEVIPIADFSKTPKHLKLKTIAFEEEPAPVCDKVPETPAKKRKVELHSINAGDPPHEADPSNHELVFEPTFVDGAFIAQEVVVACNL